MPRVGWKASPDVALGELRPALGGEVCGEQCERLSAPGRRWRDEPRESELVRDCSDGLAGCVVAYLREEPRIG
jgi:hypothetical protein